MNSEWRPIVWPAVVAKGIEAAYCATIFGVAIEDMTKEELRGMLGWLTERERDARKELREERMKRAMLHQERSLISGLFIGTVGICCLIAGAVIAWVLL